MALLGRAAMLLWYDVIPDLIAEHDDWHTRQHFPERVGIPGFIRAQRWVSSSASARYFVVYEVSDIDVLLSARYLERLNNPTSWTSRIMPGFRGMVRGFCKRVSSHGAVLGATAVTLRYSAVPGEDDRLHNWLHGDLIPDLMLRNGIASVFVLQSDRAPEMTIEQRIRGRDVGVDRVLLVTGYNPETMAGLAQNELSADSLERHGASPGATSGVYQLVCLSDTAVEGS